MIIGHLFLVEKEVLGKNISWRLCSIILQDPPQHSHFVFMSRYQIASLTYFCGHFLDTDKIILSYLLGLIGDFHIIIWHLVSCLDSHLREVLDSIIVGTNINLLVFLSFGGSHPSSIIIKYCRTTSKFHHNLREIYSTSAFFRPFFSSNKGLWIGSRKLQVY